MKPTERVLDVDSTLTGERVGMTIDQGALAHIMSVLTDLYSDPELAVIREYSTNALDAHIAAGIKRPIEVTTPSPLSPFFRVRDYGEGLDAEDIRNIYSRYGTSTKRTSNDVVGMLGLGCKSALTYTDQFTLTGIKDGRMVQVSVSRDEDGSGSMTIVAEHATDAPSGVEVIVPAKRSNTFEQKSLQFFRVWEPGTVHVNGTAPKRISGRWIEPGRILYTTATDHDLVVMGNVPYPVADLVGDDNYRNWQAQQWHRVVWVPIGTVNFTPSREALQDTKQTRETLKALSDEVKVKLDRALAKQVEQAATPDEAIQAFVDAQQIGISDAAKVLYKGKPVSLQLKRDGVSNYTEDTKGFLMANTSYRGRGKGDWSNVVSLRESIVFFENFDGKELTSYKREKLVAYFDQRGETPPTRFCFTFGQYSADERFWLGTVHDWTVVAAIKLKKDRPVGSDKWGRPRGSYDGYNPVSGSWERGIKAESIDTSKPIMYLNGNYYNGSSDSFYRKGMLPDGYIICLPANRIDKFKRDFPTAILTREAAQKTAADWYAKQKPYDLQAARFQSQGNEALRLKALDPERIDDPDIVAKIDLAKHACRATIDGLQKYYGLIPNIPTDTDPLKKYPLLDARNTFGANTREHVYLYINAAYNAEKGEA